MVELFLDILEGCNSANLDLRMRDRSATDLLISADVSWRFLNQSLIGGFNGSTRKAMEILVPLVATVGDIESFLTTLASTYIDDNDNYASFETVLIIEVDDDKIQS